MTVTKLQRALLALLLIHALTGAGVLVSSAAARSANLNGIDLYYEIHGAGEPLLLIHGGLGHSGYWHEQLGALSEYFRVITLDSRGHGRSGFDQRAIGYALMSSDVLALLDHLGIDKAHILGWSDGGIIGLELAIHHAARVRRVIAFGANYTPDGVRKDIGDNARFNAYITRAAADYQNIAPEPQRWQEFLDNIGQMWAREPHYSDQQLRGITVPVLILGGLDEEAIEIDHMRAMAVLIPGSTLTLMPGTGHFAMWEQPQVFNRIVLDYLGVAPAP